MSYKKFDHFVGLGSNAIRHGSYSTCYMYRLTLYSGGEMQSREYYFSERALTSKEVEEFESEMLHEYPQYDEAWLVLDEENPLITYIWSALDD